MAIQYVVEEVQHNGLHTTAYRVFLKNGSAYRQNEVVVGRGQDAQARVEQQLAGLWASGSDITEREYVGAGERQYAVYYATVQLKVWNALKAGGNVAAMNAAGLDAIDDDEDKLVEWLDYKATLEATEGALSDRELHFAMMFFTIMGQQAGG